MDKTENLLAQIDKDISQTVSKERYQHSVNVMKRAEELAKKFNVDVNKAKLIGLTHDIAKEMPEKLEYALKNEIVVDEIEQINIELLHAKIGAYICGKKYGFPQEMQEAIKYHTVGNPQMDDLAKVLFIADKTEQGRKHVDFEEIAKVENDGLNAEVIYLLDDSIKYTIKKGKLLHPDSINTRNRFLLEK